MFNSPAKESPLKIHRYELEQMGCEIGVKPGMIAGSKDSSDEVLTGNWEFHSRDNTVRLHYGTFKALSDVTIAFQLPPGLSLTIVFEGAMNIELGAHAYTLGSQNGLPRCAAFSVTGTEVITRHQKAGESIYKLNLFVELSWLQSFCKSHAEINSLNQLLEEPCVLHQWLPNKHVLATAEKIMKPTSHTDFMAEIERESNVFLLLSLMLKNYMSEAQVTDKTPAAELYSRKEQEPVKDFLDNLTHNIPSLEGLANTFNISVSTLQRRFKSQHGITVINYIRQKNLDNAKFHLAENRLSIGEIAFLCGYKHPSNFNNAFIKRFAISPGSYRNSHHAD